MKNRWVLSLLAMSNVSLAHYEIRARCADDLITTSSQGQGRNAWAAKCGYMDRDDEEYFNRKSLYIVFTEGNQPSDSSAPCQSGLSILATCKIGCVTPDQEVLFANTYVPIAQAAASEQILTVSSLTGEQTIAEYVAGEEKNYVLRVKSEAGHEIKVSKNHPMVRGGGDVVEAAQLKEGDTLLDEDFQQTRITSIEVVPYQGKIWNIEPRSQKKNDNVLYTQGLLNGSVRFQGMWANEAFRLVNRDKLDVSGL